MRSLLPASLLAIATSAIATHSLAAPPVIDSLPATAIPQGGSFEIVGSGFGGQPRAGEARVEIDGVPTATARWQDDRITAYVAEGVSPGTRSVRVVTSEGPSASVSLDIDPPPAWPAGVAWIFVADGVYAENRPAVGPDGTVYASDQGGFLYAVAPSGAPRWIRHLPSAGGHDDYWVGDANTAPIAVGPDGTIYVINNLLGPDLQLQAWNPDGTLRWIHSEEIEDLLGGPSIGPDGNVYFIAELQGGGGLRVLDASGQVLVSEHNFYAQGQWETWGGPSSELAFGPSTGGGAIDRVYFGSPVPNGEQLARESLVSLDLDGSVAWAANAGGQSNVFGQRDGSPMVAPGGNVYLAAERVGQAMGVHAFDPSGDLAWSYHPPDVNVMTEVAVGPAGEAFVVTNLRYVDACDDSGTRLWRATLSGRVDYGPIVHPAGEHVAVAGVFDQGAAFVAIERSTGRVGWRVEIPQVDGVVPTPTTRVRFDGSGSRGFVNARLTPNTPPWVIVAIDVPAGTSPGTGGSGGGGAAGTGGAMGGTGGGSAGNGGAGGTSNSGAGGGAGTDTGATSPEESDGCSTAGGTTGLPLLLALGLLLATRRAVAR